MKITPNIKKLIADYRAQTGHQKGYVVFWDHEIAGWKLFLDNARGWCPGCIAVSENFECYRATGGNDRDGSIEWRQVATTQGESA